MSVHTSSDFPETNNWLGRLLPGKSASARSRTDKHCAEGSVPIQFDQIKRAFSVSHNRLAPFRRQRHGRDLCATQAIGLAKLLHFSIGAPIGIQAQAKTAVAPATITTGAPSAAASALVLLRLG